MIRIIFSRCLLVLAVCNAAFAAAQNGDSLAQRAASAALPREKLALLRAASKAYRHTVPAKAYAILQDAAALARSIRADSAFTEIIIDFAYLLEDRGERDSVVAYAGYAVQLAHARGMHLDEAMAYNVLGNACTGMKAFGKEQQAYLRALTLYKALPGRQLAVGNTKVNIGNLFLAKDDMATALRYFREAEVAYAALGNTQQLAQVYNNFGMLYAQNGDLPKGEAYFTNSAALRERIPGRKGLDYSYMNLGALNILLKRWDRPGCIC